MGRPAFEGSHFLIQLALMRCLRVLVKPLVMTWLLWVYALRRCRPQVARRLLACEVLVCADPVGFDAVPAGSGQAAGDDVAFVGLCAAALQATRSSLSIGM